MGSNLGRRSRPLTTDELVNGFIGSLRSLALHCERFRDQVDDVVAKRCSSPELAMTRPVYDMGPVSDIAAQLRKLLGGGRGDDLFRRVCVETGATVPSIELTGDTQLSTPAWDKVLVEQFSLGAVPVDDGMGKATQVAEIGDRVCLALLEPGEQAVLLTWDQLVKDIGDKDGVHLDADRPLVWDFINAYHIGLVPGIPFLLFRLGVAVVEAGNEALEALGVGPVAVDTSPSLGGMTCYAMVVARTTKRSGPRPKRNDRCHCESGKKFKYCCGSSSSEQFRTP